MSNLPPLSTPRASKTKLLLMGGVVLAILAFSMISGVLQRDRMRELGGPMHVRVDNASAERARVDVYVSDQYATLELDPGEHGLLRFSPREATALRLDLYRHGAFRKGVAHGAFVKDQSVQVLVSIGEEDELRFAEKPRDEGASE